MVKPRFERFKRQMAKPTSSICSTTLRARRREKDQSKVIVKGSSRKLTLKLAKVEPTTHKFTFALTPSLRTGQIRKYKLKREMASNQPLFMAKAGIGQATEWPTRAPPDHQSFCSCRCMRSSMARQKQLEAACRLRWEEEGQGRSRHGRPAPMRTGTVLRRSPLRARSEAVAQVRDHPMFPGERYDPSC